MATVENVIQPEVSPQALEELRYDAPAPPLEIPVGVILAAGSGSRLGAGPKALARAAGVTLLERAVATFREAGVRRIVVVTGHGKRKVRKFVATRGLDVELVENDRFGVGNGSSALVGAQAAGRRFVLAMVDHIVDSEAFRRLLASEASFALAVDSRPGSCDVDEATKVRLQAGRVVAVTRELVDYDAVEAGLALCDFDVVTVAERCLAAHETTWNAVKRRWLAEGGEIAAVDLEGLFWIDVDTPADMRRADRLLVRRAARKPLDGPVARWINRRLSWPLSLALLRAGASPNAATLLAFLLSLVAAGALAAGQDWTAALVTGGVLVQLASVVDGVDGEMARASLRSSPAGSFLDSVLDRIGDAMILLGLAVAAGLDGATWAALAGALIGSLLVPYVRASYEASFGRAFPASALRLSCGRDVRLLVVALSAVVLQPLWGLVAVALLANAEVGRRFAHGWRAR